MLLYDFGGLLLLYGGMRWWTSVPAAVHAAR
jgi:hypothetical protein